VDFGPTAGTDLRQIVRPAQLGQADDQAAVPLVVVLDGRLAEFCSPTIPNTKKSNH